ncbi:hypothetical protein GCM10010172_20400 [Paractinoplanes ferrugineus]|uniref:Lipoprotein n=1 Tax=Paractinoplanes ferrugineus TaxID=113564 RepID=A0A919MC28_9ACTN|nr:hypothetical protein [Actinoplanes ferrugineus]GIE09049.1 hypothetical protein Afe05nite_08890 [Actinoplanes ferrugineus]
MTKGTRLAIAGCLLAMTAACGNDGTAAAGGGGAADTGPVAGSPVIEITVDVTGDVTVKGSTTALAATNNGVDYTSCEQYANGEDGSNGNKYFVLPKFLSGPISGKQVFVGAMVKGYHGPAGYRANQMTDAGSPPGVSFDGNLYFMGEDSGASVTVDGNGGGHWDFTSLSVQNADGTRTNGKLAGSVTWTCKNP